MCLCCLTCVRTQDVGIVEDLGQFKRLIDPGLHCILWPIQQVAGTLSLRIQQLDVTCETKTKDNVFVRVEVAVQYRVISSVRFISTFVMNEKKILLYIYNTVHNLPFFPF
jgi:regulator of protease activity HflC (stomatin/prohibitin superfamily)